MKTALAVFAIAPAALAAQSKYPTPPRSLGEAAEIALALTAAPAEVSANADVYVLRGTDFVKARAGTNGCACVVGRDSHDGSRYPICFDREGAHTMLFRELMEGSLRAKGKSVEPDDFVMAACLRLKEAGYMIALDVKKRDRLPAALADMDEVVKAGPFTAELHMDAARLYALASTGNPGLKDRAFEQLDAALKLGQPPAKLLKDVTFKAYLASDPRFGDLSNREPQAAAPQGQLHFVEPFQE